MNTAAKQSLERILYYFSLPGLLFGLIASWLLAGLFGVRILQPDMFVGTFSTFILMFLPGAVAVVALALVRIGVYPFKLGWALRSTLLAFFADLVLLAFFQGSIDTHNPSLFTRLGGNPQLGDETYLGLLIVYVLCLLLVIITSAVLLLRTSRRDSLDPDRIVREAVELAQAEQEEGPASAQNKGF